MKQQVIDTLNGIHPMSEALQHYLYCNLKTESLSRKQFFLQPGETCNKIAFIITGLMRSWYINAEGKDTSVWFMKEGDVIVSVKSFFRQQPAVEYIEALDDAVLMYITYEELQLAYQQFPEFNVVGRMLAEEYYIQSEDRLFAIRNRNSYDRYQYLLSHSPELLLRVPAKYIASYLDINEATLSRMKHKK